MDSDRCLSIIQQPQELLYKWYRSNGMHAADIVVALPESILEEKEGQTLSIEVFQADALVQKGSVQVQNWHQMASGMKLVLQSNDTAETFDSLFTQFLPKSRYLRVIIGTRKRAKSSETSFHFSIAVHKGEQTISRVFTKPCTVRSKVKGLNMVDVKSAFHEYHIWRQRYMDALATGSKLPPSDRKMTRRPTCEPRKEAVNERQARILNLSTKSYGNDELKNVADLKNSDVGVDEEKIVMQPRFAIVTQSQELSFPMPEACSCSITVKLSNNNLPMTLPTGKAYASVVRLDQPGGRASISFELDQVRHGPCSLSLSNASASIPFTRVGIRWIPVQQSIVLEFLGQLDIRQVGKRGVFSVGFSMIHSSGERQDVFSKPCSLKVLGTRQRDCRKRSRSASPLSLARNKRMEM